MKRDDLIFDIIEKEHQRQLKGIELIASENFVSDQVMQAMGSCLTNKYAEGYPGKRYYGGCEVVDQSEQIAIDRLKQIFGAEWANVQPHSGAQANAAVFLAVLNPGDKFMGLNLAHGGHLSHGSLVNTSGIIYTPCEYNLNKETGRVDYDQMEEIALREKPKMIIGGGSAYSREWDYKRMREIADKVEGLDAGANDYLSKPFHLAELEARVRSLTRRKFIQQDVCLCCGRLSFNTRSRVATVDGQTLALTRKESGVLEYLLLHQGRPVSQEELIEHVWDGSVDSFSNSIRVHISALRKKLRAVLGYDPIRNRIGEGYEIGGEVQ